MVIYVNAMNLYGILFYKIGFINWVADVDIAVFV